jgi:ABC-type transport system substrate-binding protein
MAGRHTQATARCPKRNNATGSITTGDDAPANLSLFFQDAAFDRVFGVDPRGRTFPEMATEVPTIKNGGIRNNGRTYVIHLKHGMRWSNGTEITAADAVFGWKIDYDPGGVDPSTGQTGRQCGLACVISSATAADRYTVVYHLNGVDHVFLMQDIPQFWPTYWAGAWNHDAHAATLTLNSPSFDFSGPGYPTDGPYQIYRSVRGSNGYLTQARFRPMKYYDIMSCGGSIKNITFYSYATLADQLTALRSGKLDLTWEWDISSSLPQLQGPERGYRLHVDPYPMINVMWFNVDARYGGKPNPLHDVRVRQALALALDKRSLIANTLGLHRRQTSNVIQWAFCVKSPKYSTNCADRSITGQWDPIAHRYDPNPGKGVALLDAKKLLAQTSWRRGFTLDWLERTGSLTAPTEEASTAASWARLGVTLNVSSVAAGTALNAELTHGLFQAGIFNDFLPVDGIDRFMKEELASASDPRSRSSSTESQQNISGIHNRIIDRAIAAAAATPNEKVRRREFDIVQEEMAKQDYWDVIHGVVVPYTEDGRIENLSDSVASYPATIGVLWNVWAWKVKGV